MKIKLHFELQDGSYDSLVIEEDNIEVIREKAKEEKEKRNAIDAWSEVLSE